MGTWILWRCTSCDTQFAEPQEGDPKRTYIGEPSCPACEDYCEKIGFVEVSQSGTLGE